MTDLNQPVAERDLTDTSLQVEDCRRRGVVVADAAAYEVLGQAARAAFEARCARWHTPLFFLYINEFATALGVTAGAGGQTMDGIEVVSAPGPLSLDGARYGGRLPAYGRELKAAANSGWHVVAVALVANRTVPILMARDGGAKQPAMFLAGYDFVPFYMTDLLFIDALALTTSPVRWIGVDIDDIFQPNWSDDAAARTVKIQADDVTALLTASDQFATTFETPFRLTLGFNSDWYGRQVAGDGYDDAAGDRALVEHRAQFRWFDHLPGHEWCVGLSLDELEQLMTMSRSWAIAHGLGPFIGTYAVSPNYGGMSPPYEPLYLAWRRIWGVTAASTQSVTEGFEHDGIAVMPRLDCAEACYSDHFSLAQTPPVRLEEIAATIVAPAIVGNEVSVFASHQSDYARDRLAPKVFGRAFELLRATTRLRLRNASDEDLVAQYFALRAKARLESTH